MNRVHGFTLVELAVALLIIGLLFASALIPLSAQVEVRNIADTKRTMDQIKEAIIGFAQANGRLPCPANGALPAGTSGSGTEVSIGSSCDPAFGVFGVVPWATLAVPETDAWGRRFSYRVAPAFADAIGTTWESNASTSPPSAGSQTTTTPCSPTPTPTQSSFALCTLGDIAVYTRSVSATAAVPMGSALAAVFISHGKNGYGAWQTNGIRLNPLPANNDEASNVNGTTPAPMASGIGYTQRAFFSRDPTPSSTGCTDPAPGAAGTGSPLCEFDDIVYMISGPALIGRMVSAGRLP